MYKTLFDIVQESPYFHGTWFGNERAHLVLASLARECTLIQSFPVHLWNQNRSWLTINSNRRLIVSGNITKGYLLYFSILLYSNKSKFILMSVPLVMGVLTFRELLIHVVFIVLCSGYNRGCLRLAYFDLTLYLLTVQKFRCNNFSNVSTLWKLMLNCLWMWFIFPSFFVLFLVSSILCKTWPTIYFI